MWDCFLWSGIAEGGSVYQKNIQTAVVVIVEERHAGAHGFNQYSLSGRSHILEVDAAGRSDIYELTGPRAS